MASRRSSAPSSWSLPSIAIPTCPPSRSAAAACARIERGHGRGDLRHLLAEARPERAVVGLDVVGAELARLGDEAQLLDVELLAHDPPEPLDRRALVARGDDDGGAQRLADLRPGSRGQPEPDRLARDGHRGLQRDVPLARLGEVGEVHAVERSVQVLEDRVGDERAERGEQLADLDQAGLERPERRRVAVPEPPPRAPHVPVRELVDERRDRLAGARRVVVLHPLADLGDRRVQPRDRPAVEVGRGRARALMPFALA